MFENIELIQLARGIAAHASARQELVAENIANADTPGYRAKDLAPFEAAFRSAIDLHRTRQGHMPAGPVAQADVVTPATGRMSPNGNSVSLETEMVRAAGIKGDHDRALAVYRSTLDLIRTAMGGRR